MHCIFELTFLSSSLKKNWTCQVKSFFIYDVYISSKSWSRLIHFSRFYVKQTKNFCINGYYLLIVKLHTRLTPSMLNSSDRSLFFMSFWSKPQSAKLHRENMLRKNVLIVEPLAKVATYEISFSKTRTTDIGLQDASN